MSSAQPLGVLDELTMTIAEELALGLEELIRGALLDELLALLELGAAAMLEALLLLAITAKELAAGALLNEESVVVGPPVQAVNAIARAAALSNGLSVMGIGVSYFGICYFIWLIIYQIGVLK